MCGRFAFYDADKLQSRFETENKLNYQPSYNIAPGALTPVIIRQSPNQAVFMKWGLIPFWAKDPQIGYKMINARAEDIQNKPSFRRPIRSQRCLIPANGFYEWSLEHRPYYCYLKNQDILAFAGLYDLWIDAEDKQIHSYTIVTCQPNSLIGQIHDRMPVILEKNNESIWINPTTDLSVVLQLLKPFPNIELETCPVSDKVNNPVNDNILLTRKLN
jgi:putative SOS response-associated peptidase YedK